MNRSIGIKRVYNLGDYKSLHIDDSITDIPEDLALNTEAMDKLRTMLLIDADLTYQHYYGLTIQMAKLHDGQEKADALTELRANTLDEFLNLYKKETGE